MSLSHQPVAGHQRSRMQTDLLPVQRSCHADFSAPRVDGKLLQRISANDGVAQQTVAGTVLVAGCHLEAEDKSHFHVSPLSSSQTKDAATKVMDHKVRSEVRGQGCCGLKEHLIPVSGLEDTLFTLDI